MANIRVKDLPNTNSAADTDEFIIDSSTAGTRRLSYSELKSEISTDFAADVATYGIATLDSDNKLTASQIPDSLAQGMNFVGVANSASDLTSTTQGDFYVIQTAFGSYNVGDQAVYDGSAYVRVVDGTKEISEGGTGATTLDAAKTNLEIINVGTGPSQVPLNQHLGSLAYQSSDGVSMGTVEADQVGIGNSSPSSFNSSADDLVIGNTSSGTDHGMTLVAGSTSNANRINFSDGTAGIAAYAGSINYYHSDDRLSLATNATTAVTIDSSQRVGIGTASPSSVADSGADELVIGDATGAAVGMTVASSTSGKGRINFSKGSGTDAYRGQISYNHSNDSLAFVTGGSTRWTINSSGNLVSSGGAIDFGSTTTGSGNTVTSGLLDDYEEGDWTPSVSVGSITGTGLTYVGKYTKIGRMVQIYIRVNATAQDINVSSYVGFTGVPFSFSADASGTVIGEDLDVKAQQGFASLSGTALYFSACGNSSAIGLTATLTGYI